MTQTRVAFATSRGARFELEGTADFVEAHLPEFLELAKHQAADGSNEGLADSPNNSSMPREEATQNGSSGLSLRSFFDAKHPQNVYEGIACGLYYASKHGDRTELDPQA